jgi:predicted MFS family arabinose efflux permease
VVAFQLGIVGGAFLGERFISAARLAWLPALAAVFTVIAALV